MEGSVNRERMVRSTDGLMDRGGWVCRYVEDDGWVDEYHPTLSFISALVDF